MFLVPDKRGPHNIAASIDLALYAAAPEVFDALATARS